MFYFGRDAHGCHSLYLINVCRLTLPFIFSFVRSLGLYLYSVHIIYKFRYLDSHMLNCAIWTYNFEFFAYQLTISLWLNTKCKKTILYPTLRRRRIRKKRAQIVLSAKHLYVDSSSKLKEREKNTKKTGLITANRHCWCHQCVVHV